MAIVFRGLDARELATWTAAMIDSGERLDLSAVGRPTVDKHSTGGVGDKVSLVLVPLVAACGAAVPQLSGRGLGHTGGTLDKMEAIPGWRADLTRRDGRGAAAVGGVIAAAGAGLAPADRKLYALRDVTGTVESIPLDRVVDHVEEDRRGHRRAGARREVRLRRVPARSRRGPRPRRDDGRRSATRTACARSRCRPRWTRCSGYAAGNALEVAESVETLEGGGPADLVEVTVALAREMVALAGVDERRSGRRARVGRCAARVARDGRGPGRRPGRAARAAPEIELVRARAPACCTRLDARAVGKRAWRLGAGRSRKEDPVSESAGVVCRAKPGDAVQAGDVLLELHIDDPDRLAGALGRSTARRIGDRRRPRRLVLDRIGARDGAAFHARTLAMTRLDRREIRAAPEGAAARPPRRRSAAGDDHRAGRGGGYDALPTKDPASSRRG